MKANYSQNHGVPSSNSEYQFSFNVTAYAMGKIVIVGDPQSSIEGAKLNALQLASSVPEPSSVLLIGASVLGLVGPGWRRRQP